MRDVTILMDTTQGKPARILNGLADKGVTLDAGCLFPRTEGRVMHVAVEDEEVETVRTVASRLGVSVADERECVVVPADYEGGVMAIAAQLATAGLTIHVAYFGRDGRVILATTELDKARAALGL